LEINFAAQSALHTLRRDEMSVSDNNGLGDGRGGAQVGSRVLVFEKDFHAVRGIVGTYDVLEALLKRPGSLVYELMEGRRISIARSLLVAAMIGLGAYGVVMGSYAGGLQYLVSPLKLLGGMCLSALICLPSLYIFSSMGGGRQTLPQTAGLLLLCQTLAGVLMLGFAPVAWVFAQSTNAMAFMGGLHLFIWLVATYFAVRLMFMAFRFLNGSNMGILTLWTVIFIMVSLQMSTVLRPLIGSTDKALFDTEKIFFLKHWSDCLTGGELHPDRAAVPPKGRI
jgi:hypothetical protein